jgi:hypothetical protein
MARSSAEKTSRPVVTTCHEVNDIDLATDGVGHLLDYGEARDAQGGPAQHGQIRVGVVSGRATSMRPEQPHRIEST